MAFVQANTGDFEHALCKDGPGAVDSDWVSRFVSRFMAEFKLAKREKNRPVAASFLEIARTIGAIWRNVIRVRIHW